MQRNERPPCSSERKNHGQSVSGQVLGDRFSSQERKWITFICGRCERGDRQDRPTPLATGSQGGCEQNPQGHKDGLWWAGGREEVGQHLFQARAQEDPLWLGAGLQRKEQTGARREAVPQG